MARKKKASDYSEFLDLILCSVSDLTTLTTLQKKGQTTSRASSPCDDGPLTVKYGTGSWTIGV